MSTAKQRRGFSQVTPLRRKLRRMPEEITRDIKVEIESAAQDIERDMIGGAPRDELNLVNSIGYKIGNDGFTALIGPAAESAQIKRGFKAVETGINDQGKRVGITKTGADTKATIRNKFALMQMYKALWMEFGTKGGNGTRPQPARPFIQPAWDVNRARLVKRVRHSVKKAIGRASDG